MIIEGLGFAFPGAGAAQTAMEAPVVNALVSRFESETASLRSLEECLSAYDVVAAAARNDARYAGLSDASKTQIRERCQGSCRRRFAAAPRGTAATRGTAAAARRDAPPGSPHWARARTFRKARYQVHLWNAFIANRAAARARPWREGCLRRLDRGIDDAATAFVRDHFPKDIDSRGRRHGREWVEWWNETRSRFTGSICGAKPLQCEVPLLYFVPGRGTEGSEWCDGQTRAQRQAVVARLKRAGVIPQNAPEILTDEEARAYNAAQRGGGGGGGGGGEQPGSEQTYVEQPGSEQTYVEQPGAEQGSQGAAAGGSKIPWMAVGIGGVVVVGLVALYLRRS